MGFLPMFYFTGVMVKLFSVAVYFLGSYAIYKLSIVRGVANPWMSFIPIFNLFMFGMVGDSLKYTDSQIDELLGNIPLAYALPIISLVTSMMGGSLGILGGIILQAASVLVYYLIFNFYSYKNRILFTILSIIPLAGPLLTLYCLRDRKIGY